MPLTLARQGHNHKVMAINGPEATRMRLVNMGITAGIPVRVISRSPSSILVSVRDTRIMLDNRLALQIYVQ